MTYPCPCPDGCNGCERIAYFVYLCGPTDCFLHAIFHNKQAAEQWAEASAQGEGWLIRNRLIDEAPKLWNEE